MRVIGGFRLMAACFAVILVVAGCGSGSKPSTSANATTETTTPAQTTPKMFKNTLAKPHGPGPHPGAKVDRLIVKDLVTGTGAELHSGDTGVFDFIVANWITGKAMDASWGKKKPYSVVIDHGVVIDGWSQGIPGMRVGGHRTLLVPPALGFTQNIDEKVQKATTYFDVVLLGVIPARPAGTGQPPAAQ